MHKHVATHSLLARLMHRTADKIRAEVKNHILRSKRIRKLPVAYLSLAKKSLGEEKEQTYLP